MWIKLAEIEVKKKKALIETDNPFFFTHPLKTCKLFKEPFDWRNIY